MPTFKTTGYWQQTDQENGRVMSGATFTCCHCGNLVDVIYGQDMAMCDYEKLPICHTCSIRYHSNGKKCPASVTRLSWLERCRQEQEASEALLKSLGVL